MKARIRRISASVDTALSPTSSSDACINVNSSDLNSSPEISHGYNNNPSSKSLDICVPESRIERMRKLLSSPLLKRKNASQHGHVLCSSHHHQKQLPTSSSSSSSPSSSPALGSTSNASMKTFGVSLESLSHHQHPHHQQHQHQQQHYPEEYYVRDPEQIVVPHQKAAHILGQACPGCLTSAPSNSSSTGSINDTSSGHFSPHGNPMEDLNSSLSSIMASPLSGNSSSSTTSSASSTGPNIPCLIPYIVTRLCTYIETSGGMVQEGLFRISGNAKLVDKLKQSFDNLGDAPLETDGDLATAAALLKQFLRELPQPLIPNGSQFLDVIRSLKNDRETCVLSLKALVSQLPDENYYTLRYLIRFLHRIAQRNEENRMTSTNLGIVFAPNIFRVCVDTYQGLKDQSSANEVVNLLISDFAEIFNETIDVNCHSAGCAGSSGDISCESESQCPCSSFPVNVEASEQDYRGNCENLIVTIESSRSQLSTSNLENIEANTNNNNNNREIRLKLDRKRKSYQNKNHRTIYEFNEDDRCQSFDYGQNPDFPHGHPPQRCNSEEMYSKNETNRFGLKKDDLYRKNSHSHDIIITNSSDSVSTDDNTTATSTGPTVCSVIIGVEKIDICNQSGDMTDISEDNFGQNLPDYSKLLACDISDVKGNRSSSCGSDCTENINVPTSLSFASDEDEDSLLKSIASECSDNDSTSSNDSDHDNICSDNESDLDDNNINQTQPVISSEVSNDFEEKNVKKESPNHLLKTKPWFNIEDWTEAQPSQLSKHHFCENEQDENNLHITADANKEDNKEVPISASACQYFAPFPTIHKEACGLLLDQNNERKLKDDDELEKVSNIHGSKSRNRRLQSIRRKLKQFEIDFEQENGYKATFENKMISSFARPLMLELNSLLSVEKKNKDLEILKKEVDMEPKKQNLNEDSCASIQINHSWNIAQNNYVFTTEDIFNTIFGSRKEKCLAQISEMIAEIQRTLNEKRTIAQRPESLDSMTSEQIFDEKLALQKALLRFEALCGRPNSKAERDIVRPVYDRYRLVKRYATKITQKQSQKLDQNSELQPILEHVQMNFTSPTHQKSILDKINSDIKPSNKYEDSQQQQNIQEDSSSSSYQKACDTLNSKEKNYHVMSHYELLAHLHKYREQKRNLRSVLRTFENDFYKKTGRRVEKEDRCNMSSVYTCYKNTKGKIKLIEALASKKIPKE